MEDKKILIQMQNELDDMKRIILHNQYKESITVSILLFIFGLIVGYIVSQLKTTLLR